MTIWLVILFLECSLVQLFQTEGTDKVLRVKLAEHSSDTAASDGSLTARTQGALLGMVVCFAVWKAFVIEEASSSKWVAAVLKW